MKNDNKNDLLNAGCKEDLELKTSLFIENEHYKITICYKTLMVGVQSNKMIWRDFFNFAKSLEDVQKICYPFLGFNLDFSEKPKYDWETGIAKIADDKGVYDAFIATWAGLEELARLGLMSKSERLSMVAKMKLQLIIQQIDKEFPRETHREFKNNIGIVKLDEEGSLKTYLSDRRHAFLNNFTIITASFEGAEQLLKSNPELLNQLFKIKSDATG